jgi:hypothetical protein
LLFLHLALLLAWRPALRSAPPAVPRGELTFILPPRPAAAVPPPRSVAPARVLPQAQRRSSEPQAITIAPPPPIAPPAPATVADPFAAPDKSLSEIARGSVGDTMKALRKETPHAFLRTEQSDSAIARALAKAAGPASRGTALEEMVLPDGRRMTRVRAGGSTYCVAMESAGGAPGRDVFRDPPKARTMTCPN